MIEELKAVSPFSPSPPSLLLTPFAPQNRPLAETVPRNALDRFEASLVKTFGARLEALEDAQIEESDDVRLVKEWVAKVEGEEEEFEGEDDDDDEEESEGESEEEDE